MDVLRIQGLEHLEQLGCDSCGLGFDDRNGDIRLIKAAGKQSVSVKLAVDVNGLIADLEANGEDDLLETHLGLAHTRWATHGDPTEANAHPQSNDPRRNEFVVVHNGMITNYRELRTFLESKGFEFRSETDTEAIVILLKHVYSLYPDSGFRQLVEIVCQQLEGAFALCFKSVYFPGECVVTQRGSPLVIGINSVNAADVDTESIPILYTLGKSL